MRGELNCCTGCAKPYMRKMTRLLIIQLKR